MANTNIRIACVLLFFLILHHHQHLCVQGKTHLKPWSKDGENFSNDDDDAHEGRKGRVEFEEKDFRPTSPGHSPGVGHSINN